MDGAAYRLDIVAKARFNDSATFFVIHVEPQSTAPIDFPSRFFLYFPIPFEARKAQPSVYKQAFVAEVREHSKWGIYLTQVAAGPPRSGGPAYDSEPTIITCVKGIPKYAQPRGERGGDWQPLSEIESLLAPSKGSAFPDRPIEGEQRGGLPPAK